MKKCEWCEEEFPRRKESQRACSRSCAQKLRNKELGFGQESKRPCEWCKKDFIAKGIADYRRFCGKSCHAKWRNAQPEYRAKVFTKESAAKISAKTKKYCADHPEFRKMHSERMKKNNPGSNPAIVEKMKATKRLNGTLNVWLAERGGNGKLTEPQTRLALALGWEMEVAISLGKRQEGFPTCYKIDVASKKLKMGIEVDGKGHLSKGNMLRDAKKEKALTGLGWKILRFTNQEIMNNLSSVLLVIKKEVKAL